MADAAKVGAEHRCRKVASRQTPRVAVKNCRQRVAFVSAVGGDLRRFEQDPLALPPFPCRLCSQGFASRRLLFDHIDSEHVSLVEYRKRLFFLLSSFEHVEPVRPQVWRHATEAFTEHSVLGSDSWPACRVNEGASGLSSVAWSGTVVGESVDVSGQRSSCCCVAWWRYFH